MNILAEYTVSTHTTLAGGVIGTGLFLGSAVSIQRITVFVMDLTCGNAVVGIGTRWAYRRLVRLLYRWNCGLLPLHLDWGDDSISVRISLFIPVIRL